MAADPNALEDQLSRTKALNNEFVSQGRLIDNAKQVCTREYPLVVGFLI